MFGSRILRASGITLQLSRWRHPLTGNYAFTVEAGYEFLWFAELCLELETLTGVARTANGPSVTLPPVLDPTDQRLLAWVKDDPDLTDQAIGSNVLALPGRRLIHADASCRRWATRCAEWHVS